MTVKARIALGIAFLLIVIVALGLVSSLSLDRIQQRNTVVYAEDYRRLTTLEEFLSEVNLLSTALLNPAEAPEATAAFAAYADEAVPNLRSPDDTAAESFVIDGIATEAGRLVGALGRDIETDPAARLAARGHIIGLSTRLHTLYAQNEEVVAAAFADTQRISDAARRQLVILGAICALFATGVLIWLPNYVTQPFRSLGRSIEAIAAGDFRTRLAVSRGDEFGRLAKSFNDMAARLQTSNEASVADLMETQDRLTELVDNLRDLIIGMDRERNIVFINKPMADYLGVDRLNVVDRYMPDVALANPKLQRLFEPIATGEHEQIDPFAERMPDGREAFLQERVVSLEDTRSDVGGYIIILTDVTDYEERTNRRTDFLSTLSHEMKTPIAAVKMCVELLEDTRLGHLDDDQRELTGTIRANNARLLRMVNEVLQLSENVAGETKLELSSVRLPQLLEDSVEAHAPLLASRGLRASVSLPEQPEPIEADAERVAWVVNNLLSNAARYAPEGSTVRLSLRSVPGGVRLAVEDDGPGVPPAERERIFEKYARAANDKTTGTGLGLAISREYVAAHGGRIYVDPDYDRGARFVLELPRQLSAALRQQHATLPG